MNTIGLDFVIIKDHRGFESGFFWSDVQQFLGEYEREEWVRVKFRNDREGFYSLKFKMPVKEFLEEIKKQLNHPPKLYADNKEFLSPKCTPNPYDFPPPPAAEFFKPCETNGV